jgi:toxin ParE1/3/4
VKLRFTPSAKTELLSAAEYINKENPEAALNFLKKADDLLHRLEKHPLSGRTIPEYPELPYRELLVLPYRFFYSIENKTIWIVAVWHTSQLPKEPNKRGRLTIA